MQKKRCDWDIVNRVVAPDDLEPAVRELAERLRDAPPISIAAAKQAVYLSQSADLEEMLRYETEAQLRCFESEDGREGIRRSWKNDRPSSLVTDEVSSSKFRVCGVSGPNSKLGMENPKRSMTLKDRIALNHRWRTRYWTSHRPGFCPGRSARGIGRPHGSSG